jgi:hypothetical protein
MITIRQETTLLYSGDYVTYANAPTDWLFNQAHGAKNRRTRILAAAGIVRSLLDVPADIRDDTHTEATLWATDLLLSTRSKSKPLPNTNNPYVASLAPVSGLLDSVTTTATKANKPLEVAAMLQKITGTDQGIALIGIGHGGIIGAADTFLGLKGDDNFFFPVRYSRNKLHDRIPLLGNSAFQLLKKNYSGQISGSV